MVPLYKWRKPILACFGKPIEVIQDRCEKDWISNNDNLMYKEYGIANNNAVEDGENVQQSCSLVKLSEMIGLRFKVDVQS